MCGDYCITLYFADLDRIKLNLCSKCLNDVMDDIMTRGYDVYVVFERDED
jgi:hypothetical protein